MLLEYEVIWGHIDILVVAVRRHAGSKKSPTYKFPPHSTTKFTTELKEICYILIACHSTLSFYFRTTAFNRSDIVETFSFMYSCET